MNLNAHNVASAIAQHLGAEKLNYLTDVDGLLLQKKLQQIVSLKIDLLF